jgi:hypothetical protein
MLSASSVVNPSFFLSSFLPLPLLRALRASALDFSPSPSQPPEYARARPSPCHNAATHKRMWKLLRYYWLTAKGYRLNPWNSPYLRWRFETFLGAEAADMTASKFFKLSWKYRNQLESFLYWADERRRIQRRKR